MPEIHWAAHAGNNMPTIKRVLAIDESYQFINVAGSNFRLQAKMKAGFPLRRFQGFKVPALIRSFAMGGMYFASIRFLISAKRHAEKVAAQYLERRG